MIETGTTRGWWPWARATLYAVAVCATGLVPTQDGTHSWVPGTNLTHALLLTAAAFVAARLLPARWPLGVLALASTQLDSLAKLVCLVTASYVIASWYRRPAEPAVYAVAVLVATAAPQLSFEVNQVMGFLGGTVLLVWLPMLAGLWVRVRRLAMEALRDKASRLEREREAVAARARAEERNRIAHEMHDVVAHRVTLMVMHAGGLEVNASDSTAAATAELIRTTGTEALGQLRDVLGVLRGNESGAMTPQPTMSDLDSLLEESRRAGVDARLTSSGNVRPLPALAEQTAFRVTREALTNVHKHAGTVSCEVNLDYGQDLLDVTVRNSAPQRPSSLPGSGSGLVGLRERLALLGGELSTADTPEGGFTLAARIPVHRETELA